MKILLIDGGNDYAASIFERKMTVKEAYERLSNGQELDPKNKEFKGTILEFEDVDPKFVEFIKNNFQNFEDIEHENFYIIEK